MEYSMAMLNDQMVPINGINGFVHDISMAYNYGKPSCY